MNEIEKFEQLLEKHKNFKFETVFTKKRMYETYLEYSKTIQDRKLNIGFSEIDNCLGGIRPSEIITVVAPTNIGKSAFAMNVAYNIAEQTKYNIILFSLEMSEIDIFERFLQMQTGNNSYSLENLFKKNDEEFLKKVKEAVIKFNNVISVVKRIHINEILTYCLAIKELTERENALIILDYVGLIENGVNKNDYQNITDIMRKLKEIALHIKIPIMLLSQTDRVNSKEGNLGLHSGKGSGEVENTSNILFTLERLEEIPAEQIDGQTIEMVTGEHKTHNLLLLTNHKKKRGTIPKPTYILFNRSTLRMEEYLTVKQQADRLDQARFLKQSHQQTANF